LEIPKSKELKRFLGNESMQVFLVEFSWKAVQVEKLMMWKVEAMGLQGQNRNSYWWLARPGHGSLSGSLSIDAPRNQHSLMLGS
jgi:hypothetical protein